MKRWISMGLIGVSVLELVACGQGNKSNQSKIPEGTQITAEVENDEEDNIVKFPSDGIDFTNVEYQVSETNKDEKIKNTIVEVFNYNKETDGILRYYYNRIDLNGDGKNETVVYLVGPYVSGSGGSTALILEESNGGYEVISKISLARNPIIVSEETTNGWKNLIMQVSGGGIEPFYAAMKFDGNKYPSNPSVQPSVEEGSIIKGVAVIADNILSNPGIELE